MEGIGGASRTTLRWGVAPRAPWYGKRLLKLSVLFAFTVLVLALLRAPGAQAWPQRLTLKELSRETKALSRYACRKGYGTGAECSSYSAKCRRFTHNRIECYHGQVVKLDDPRGPRDEMHYLEHREFVLWYPPDRRSHGLPREFDFTPRDVLLRVSRCAPKNGPYLCNGRWVFRGSYGWGSFARSAPNACGPRPKCPPGPSRPPYGYDA